MKPVDFNDKECVLTGKFMACGKYLSDGPEWGMSLKKCGSMRFRWNEKNPVRENFIENLCGTDHVLCAVELIHSKTVCAVSEPEQLDGVKADGIITCKKDFVPAVTVADCVPIFMWNPVAGVFGTLHSGWKGTGIVRNALLLAKKEYGARAEDFSVVVGPHIHKCCYKVKKDRAQYFIENFGEDCVTPCENGKFSLSLMQANYNIMRQCGIPCENIILSDLCTCCNPLFGSFRRETGSDISVPFTVQIAWTRFV